MLHRGVHGFLERRIEALEHGTPIELSTCNDVKLPFDICREVVVQDVLKVLQQKVIDDQSDVCREQLSALLAGVLGGGFRLDSRPRKRQNAIVSGGAVAVLFHHVAALLHDVDGGGVGRRAADAQFLQSLHKAGLGVARRDGARRA